MKNKKKPLFISLSILLLILATYLSSYLYLTLNGGKWRSQSGKIKYYNGMSVSDIVEWRPKGLWWQYPFKNVYGKNVSRGNGWGYFYSPLIYLDRKFWHKTEIIIKEKQ